MPRLRVGIVRYASVADAIEKRLVAGGRPTCQIGQGRLYIVLRGVGATKWEPSAQLAYALNAAAVAREVLAEQALARVRDRAHRAIVVRLEDVAVARGCEVRTEWQCIVPPIVLPLQSIGAEQGEPRP